MVLTKETSLSNSSSSSSFSFIWKEGWQTFYLWYFLLSQIIHIYKLNLFEFFATIFLGTIRAAVSKVSSQVIALRVNLVAELDRTRQLVIVIYCWGSCKIKLNLKRTPGQIRHLGGAPEKPIWIVF